MSTDLHTLSGAFAVNALSAEEAAEFARHLDECAACRDEVGELQEAAAVMGASEALRPPAALKARVLAAADQQPQLPPKVTPIEAVRSRRRWVPLLAATAAALVVIAGAAIGLRPDRTDEATNLASAVTQVFAAPDVRTKTVATDHGVLTVGASPTMGRIAVDTDRLDSPGNGRVYQMWTVHSGTSTSAGLLRDLEAGKAMALPGEGTTVAITIEPAGGSEQPTTRPFIMLDPKDV